MPNCLEYAQVNARAARVRRERMGNGAETATHVDQHQDAIHRLARVGGRGGKSFCREITQLQRG